MKNKITILAVAFAMLSTLSLKAQDMKPHDGEMGFTFGVSGISSLGVNASLNLTNTLLFRNYMSDNMVARVGLNLINTSTTVYSLGQGSKTTTTNKTSGFAINVGMQHNFTGTDRLEPYMGVDLGIGTGGSSSNVRSEAADSVGNPTTPENSVVTDTKNGGTFAFGITPCMGFNYFLNQWFSIGAEFGYGLWSTSTGDGTTTTTTVVNGGSPSVTTSTSLGGKSMSLGGSSTGSFNISVFFDR